MTVGAAAPAFGRQAGEALSTWASWRGAAGGYSMSIFSSTTGTGQ